MSHAEGAKSPTRKYLVGAAILALLFGARMAFFGRGGREVPPPDGGGAKKAAFPPAETPREPAAPKTPKPALPPVVGEGAFPALWPGTKVAGRLTKVGQEVAVAVDADGLTASVWRPFSASSVYYFTPAGKGGALEETSTSSDGEGEFVRYRRNEKASWKVTSVRVRLVALGKEGSK